MSLVLLLGLRCQWLQLAVCSPVLVARWLSFVWTIGCQWKEVGGWTHLGTLGRAVCTALVRGACLGTLGPAV